MPDRRDPAPDLVDLAEIDFRESDTHLLAHVEQYRPPRIDKQGMAVGFAPVLVAAALRGGDDEHPRFDGTRPKKDFPMRPSGRNREGRGHRDDLRSRVGKALEKSGEAKVVADRQAEIADRCPGNDDGFRSAAIDVGLAPALARGKVDIEQVEARTSPVESMAKPRFANFPSSAVTASEPR